MAQMFPARQSAEQRQAWFIHDRFGLFILFVELFLK